MVVDKLQGVFRFTGDDLLEGLHLPLEVPVAAQGVQPSVGRLPQVLARRFWSDMLHISCNHLLLVSL